MKILIVYKGDYTKCLRAPEMRYLRLAENLVSSGVEVRIVGRTFEKDILPKQVKAIRFVHIYELLCSFLWADIILLHGGGPWIFTLTALSSLIGKTVIFDAYAPRWIELDEEAVRGSGTFLKRMNAAYNRWRLFIALLIFDAVLVGNQRQMDLLRGFTSPIAGISFFGKLKILEFGSEKTKLPSRQKARRYLSELLGSSFRETDFLIGWFGGMYEWFDSDTVIKAANGVALSEPRVKFVFFGVPPEIAVSLRNAIREDVRERVFFWGWVEFEKRFDYWAAFDVSLVWGGDGIENEYASRTRNFDCLTLAMPIVQNYDDEWGRRIIDNNIGLVCDGSELSRTLIDLSRNPVSVQKMSESILSVRDQFTWQQFTQRFREIATNGKVRLMDKYVGATFVVLVLPLCLVTLFLAPGVKR